MITIRPAPYSSATGGASWRIHSTLKRMCSRPPCSQPADSTVHQRWRARTGSGPAAPKTNRLARLGARMLNNPPMPIPDGSATRVAT